MMQRLLEIDTYRLMALLALPVAQALSPWLNQAERELAEVTNVLAEATEADEPALLDRLTRLEAQIESREAENHFRFTAAAAYHELVQRRIEELREVRIQGLQNFEEFTERRLAPAMNTCRSVAGRLESLSQRVARATQLLSTRVDVSRERQNQQVLVSMNRRAEAQRGVKLALVRFDEQRDTDARRAQLLGNRGKGVVHPRRVEPTFGGALLALFGDDAGSMRLVTQRDGKHLAGRRHFEVERKIGRRLNPRQILVADMAAVFAKVRGDPVAAHGRDDLRCTHRIGMIPTARIADGGDVIDVHAKAEGIGAQGAGSVVLVHSFRLPGLVTSTRANASGMESGAKVGKAIASSG
jgi:hypothetical protein